MPPSDVVQPSAFTVGVPRKVVKNRYDSALVVTQECDGVGLMLRSKCELLQKVRKCQIDIFKAESLRLWPI